MKIRIYSILAFLTLVISACNSDYVPKPRGYFKIELPRKKYQQFDKPGFPYTFEYPVYGQVVQDSLFFDQKPENPYWININFPQFNSVIYISYKEIGKNKFDSLVNDAYTLSYKQHTYKASGIQQQPFVTPNHVAGVYFILKGNAATANQFFATDSTKHFLRGALYFAATPNEDSLKPVNNFLREDVKHLIATLKWR
ncbi:MAG TPA: gliding motility lipoprotein GldD [Flavisolibacter sp.]|nr:gliding motility lipoprotein GldD [Flavisolibacter sp.]